MKWGIDSFNIEKFMSTHHTYVFIMKKKSFASRVETSLSKISKTKKKMVGFWLSQEPTRKTEEETTEAD